MPTLQIEDLTTRTLTIVDVVTRTVLVANGTAGGGGSGGGSITVQGPSGSPSVANVNTIQIAGGTVEDKTGGVVQISVGVAGMGSQTKALFLATPTAKDGAPTFRAIVAGDLPTTVAFTDVANTFAKDQTFEGNASFQSLLLNKSGTAGLHLDIYNNGTTAYFSHEVVEAFDVVLAPKHRGNNFEAPLGSDFFAHSLNLEHVGYSYTADLAGTQTFLRFHPTMDWDGKGAPGLRFVSYTGATPADGYTPVSKASLTLHAGGITLASGAVYAGKGTGLTDVPVAGITGLAAIATTGSWGDLLSVPANVDAFGNLVSVADSIGYFTGSGTMKVTTFTTQARNLLDDTTEGEMQTTIGGTTIGRAFFTATNPSAVTFPRANADNSLSLLSASDYRTAIGTKIGTDVQAYNVNLAAMAGLTGEADRGVYFTGAGALALYTQTSFARNLLDDADAATARGTLGVNNPILTIDLPNGTYTILRSARHAFTINTAYGAIASAGSGTLTVAINGTPVTGINAAAVTTTPADLTATAANTVSVGNYVEVTVAGLADNETIAATIQGTRT